MTKARNKPDIYAGKDPLETPAYTLTEVARYLQVPQPTVRTWVLGRRYATASGKKFARPLIDIAEKGRPSLCFRNVIELHVLSAIRRRHKVEMSAVRKAIAYLRRSLGVLHPLCDQQMVTDGRDLFIERYGRLLNISRGGQLEMKEIVDEYLSRIERDSVGVPIRLFPFTRSHIEGAPRMVSMNPRIQFGRPCIAGTGIPTSVIAERYKAGDSIRELARDYGQKGQEIEEALRFELEARAACATCVLSRPLYRVPYSSRSSAKRRSGRSSPQRFLPGRRRRSEMAH